MGLLAFTEHVALAGRLRSGKSLGGSQVDCARHALLLARRGGALQVVLLLLLVLGHALFLLLLQTSERVHLRV